MHEMLNWKVIYYQEKFCEYVKWDKNCKEEYHAFYNIFYNCV